MADEIDLANEQSERWLAQALSRIGSSGRLVPRGRCYYCDSEFGEHAAEAAKKLFCDKDCSDDYEKERRLRSINS